MIDSASALSQVLARLRKRPEAYPFLRPVEWKKLGLDDYPELVPKPMDLQTLGRHVRDGRYNEDDSEFFTNLQLIWDNCKTYNDEDTEIYAMAEKMEEAAEEIIEEVFPNRQMGANEVSRAQRGSEQRRSEATAAEDEVRSNKRRRTANRRNSDASANLSPGVITPTSKKSVKRAARGSNKPLVPNASMTSEEGNGGDGKAAEMAPLTVKHMELISRFYKICPLLKPPVLAKIVRLIVAESKDAVNLLPAVPARGRRVASQSMQLDLRKVPEEKLEQYYRVIKCLYKTESNE